MCYSLSVIIPVYNVEAYISQCLDTLINQSFGINNFEVILVNDGSSDGSLRVIERYSKQYPSIKVINLKSNLGTGMARNIGLSHASGEYISFIDADDFISVNSFECMTEIFKQHNCDIVIFEYEYYSELGKTYLRNPSAILFEQEKMITDIRDYPEIIFATSVCNKMFTKQLLSDLWFSNSQMEDVLFSTKTTFMASRVYITNRCKYYYRKRDRIEDMSKTDTYFLIKENYLDHLQVNCDLKKMINEYPEYKTLIDTFNAKTLHSFVYHMIFNNIFTVQEQKAYYNKARMILLGTKNINISNEFSLFIINTIQKSNYYNFVVRIIVNKLKRFMKKCLKNSSS
ncbi:glycosyltransferase family 2 protein [Paenibacillus dendritiformis]|uniref:glycosyltransferase family 2 protein n=1 Tax=Paenibacillus dendritiformis TaxID=130049 RepID=UPI000DA9E021|nr:glycosyltransferase family 2 protein [Paenibacillus dendritiformis]PZM67229.1 hypothetical protein DOE73_01970 [Paenibacillus dendritiformis]